MKPVKLVVILPRRASAVVVREPEGAYYFDSVRVPRNQRRRGFCTEMLRFATNYLGTRPQIDIKRTSPVAQRIAIRAGYRRKGPSERFYACDLWLPTPRTRRKPPCRLVTLNVVTYPHGFGVTEVVYVRDDGGPER